MDQRRYRGRTFHRVRQPGVERNLCRFTCGTKEESESDYGNENPTRLKQVCIFRDLHEVHRPDPFAAEGPEQGQQAAEKAEVTDPVDNKRLLGSITSTLLLDVVTDQQVGTETDTFPADKHNQRVVAENQEQHGAGEQVQIAEEAVEALFTVHVTDRVEVDQGTDTGNDQNHDSGQRIKQEAPLDLQVPYRDPGTDRLLKNFLFRAP